MDGGLGSESILQTKIVHPPVKSVVRRQRLYERLDGGAARKLTLVSAPAGYGKTTLVSSWLSERSLDCCWVNLDQLDSSAQRVATYLGAALCLESPPGSNRWVAFLNALTARQRQTMIVLDDYHLAESAEVNDLVMSLLENLPQTTHVVIITRIDPTMRLAKLRGQAELVEIRQADLAFTLEECKAFLAETGGISLASEEVQALSYTTEGWAAGLQILASSLKDRADAHRLLRGLRAGHRYLHDYLVEEVLDGLDQPTLAFMERCSILERLSADLCDAVTGRADSRELLLAIDRRNLFISPLDEDRRWFRLHHLFAEVLLARLQAQHAEELPALHRKASEWFTAHGQPVEAINHRVAAGDADAAAELINENADWLMRQGELMRARRWITLIPKEVCARYPAIVLIRAWAGIDAGRPLAEIERELDSAGEAGTYRALALCLRSHIAGLQGDDEKALRLSEQALRKLDGNDLFVNGHAKLRVAIARLASGEMRTAIDLLESAANESLQAGNPPVAVEALAHKARAMVEQGQLDEGEETYQRALDLAMSHDGSRRGYASWALIGLGEVSRLRGTLPRAVELFRNGMAISAYRLDLNAFYTSLGFVHALLARGLEADATQALRSAEQLALGSSVPLYFVRFLEAHRVLILLRCGRLQEARARLKEIPTSGQPAADESYVEALVSDLETLGRARLALLEGNARACMDLAFPLARRAREQERELNALSADLLLVRASWQAEESDQATSILDRGLSFAADRGIVQPFVDEGPEMARVLYHARSLGLTHPFIGKLLAAFPLDQQSTAAAETQPNAVEPLSAREVKVLTLLSQGLSNKEVAAELFVSVKTVKWYASSIYAKLAVSSRTQAIAKARQLAILP